MTVKYKNLTASVSDKMFHCGIYFFEDSKFIMHQSWNVRPDYDQIVDYLKMLYEAKHKEEKK